ncbi:hypothetical protein PIB30_053433 [Stylosanthes scabra]|uniref:Uncharacterized protein n=1 Tax=Stylosanthes scabra TaxID=79078 RepID=A0ABU6QIB6_9FABA|nr:hypothetical protein [Stylosanthes scabra]
MPLSYFTPGATPNEGSLHSFPLFPHPLFLSVSLTSPGNLFPRRKTASVFVDPVLRHRRKFLTASLSKRLHSFRNSPWLLQQDGWISRRRGSGLLLGALRECGEPRCGFSLALNLQRSGS